MSPSELLAARSEAERLVKGGFHLRAVSALKKLARADLPLDEQHDTHLRLAKVYRAMGLEAESNREILAVASHWNFEGRTADVRNLLASTEGLLPGGVAMLGDLPAGGEAARDAIDELLRALRLGNTPVRVKPEETPIDELLSGSKLPALPSAPSASRGGPRVPLPAPALDTSSNRADARVDQAIARLGAAVQRDPSDIALRLRLAELLLKTGRTPDGIVHLVLVAKHHEKHGEPHKAIAVYKDVLKVAPERKELHNRLGDIFTHLGMLTEAANEYQKAGKPR